MEQNPEKIKFIEQFIIAYLVDCSQNKNRYFSRNPKTPENWYEEWAREGVYEANLAWNAIQPLRANNYNL